LGFFVQKSSAFGILFGGFLTGFDAHNNKTDGEESNTRDENDGYSEPGGSKCVVSFHADVSSRGVSGADVSCCAGGYEGVG
jgi:hypothetical protein